MPGIFQGMASALWKEWALLLSDGVLGILDGFKSLLDGVFHHGHATTDGVFDQLDLLKNEDVDFAPGALRIFFRLTEDLFSALPGLGEDGVLGDQHSGTLMRDLDDAIGLILRFADDAFTLLNHALSLGNLVREGGAELINKSEEIFLLDHHPAAERHPLPDSDKLFKLIHKVEDIGCPIGLLHSAAAGHYHVLRILAYRVFCFRSLV